MKKAIATLLSLFSIFILATCGKSSPGVEPERSEQPRVLVALGDSIANGGIGTDDRDTQSYAAIVAAANGYTLYNDAVDGYKSGDLLYMLETDDNVRCHVTDADITVISIGANDVWISDPGALLAHTAGGDYSGINALLSDFKDNLDDVLYSVSTLSPGATVILQTLYNPVHGDDGLRAGYQIVCDALNEIITGTDCRVLDVAAAFDGHPEYIYLDGIHPSIAGHAKIAEILIELLSSVQ